MSRLIDADALMNTLQELFDQREKEQIFTGSRGSCVTWNDAIYHIKSAPTIDAVEVKHGEWELVDQEEPRRYGCSVCKRLSFYVTNYCSYCGAKMDGEVNRNE